MTRQEQRAAERASMLHHYREYQKVRELTAPDGSLAVIFSKPELLPKCFALAFSGAAGKTTFHYSYRTIEQAEQAAAAFIQGREAHEARMGEQKKARTAFKTTLQVGSVLVNSWGYDQTNVDYYQVVKVSATGRTVTIRQIGARAVEDGPVALSGSCWPLADHFIGPELVKVVSAGDRLKIHSWGSWAHPWEPKPDRWSAYA